MKNKCRVFVYQRVKLAKKRQSFYYGAHATEVLVELVLFESTKMC